MVERLDPQPASVWIQRWTVDTADNTEENTRSALGVEVAHTGAKCAQLGVLVSEARVSLVVEEPWGRSRHVRRLAVDP